MHHKENETINSMKRLHSFKVIIFMFMMQWLLLVVISMMSGIIFPSTQIQQIILLIKRFDVEKICGRWTLLVVGIMFPIIRTILGIYIPIEFMSKIKFIRENTIAVPILCGIIWGIHIDLLLLEKIYITGLWLIYIYSYVSGKGNKRNAICLTIMIQAVYNLVIYSIV
ncbi:hypothetical protein QTL86_16655 [Cellulosilyticum sp. ST5]|uniref:hypothetical protein n=1 Tax=Cellulosilyticum sp. ST5 TaxID=3055805 RepID=UPI003977520E